MATPNGELLACQPYAGAKTQIPDVGLGQGPNVVVGLAEQFGLSPGSKISCDNLFTNFDLLDHLAEKKIGVIGTVRQNRIVGVPLPAKKEAARIMKRGQIKTVYDEKLCLTCWRDSQPVYMTSNFCGPDPIGACKRYSAPDKKYIEVPCPNIVLQYNRTMGGVDLLNQSQKNYRVNIRIKKWYWPFYGHYLNVQMVQAWRLYRATMKSRNEQAREEEQAADEEFENSLVRMLPQMAVMKRKEREEEKKKLRKEEKKREELPLLDFVRETVELILEKHGEGNKMEKVARHSAGSGKVIRFDKSRPHIIIRTQIQGRCGLCNKRSYYRRVDFKSTEQKKSQKSPYILP